MVSYFLLFYQFITHFNIYQTNKHLNQIKIKLSDYLINNDYQF